MFRDRFRGLFSRHPRALAGLFSAYWFAMFLATHIEMPHVESAPQNTDKLVHLVMYAGFAFLLSLWLSARKPVTGKTLLLVLGAAISYGVLDELLQIPTQTRSAEVWDFVMDLLGTLLGLLTFWLFHRRFAWFWTQPEAADSWR
jgi:VanZ family protein